MKVVNWILLGACVLNCIIIDLIFVLKPNSITNSGTAFDKILNSLEILIIFVNFIFVVWMYFRDEKKDKTKILLEKRGYWYHEILIQGNIKQIQHFFGVCISIKEEIKSDSSTDDIKLIVRKVKNEKKIVEESIGYMLNAYDENLYNEFNTLLLEVEDVATTNIAKFSLAEIDDEEYVKGIKSCEVKVMKLLMDHDLGNHN